MTLVNLETKIELSQIQAYNKKKSWLRACPSLVAHIRFKFSLNKPFSAAIYQDFFCTVSCFIGVCKYRKTRVYNPLINALRLRIFFRNGEYAFAIISD